MIYARSNTVESNPRYQAAVAEQRRREQAKAEARKRAELAKSVPEPVITKEQLAEQRRERDRRMFEEAAQKFPVTLPDADDTIAGIIARVASEHGLMVSELLSKCRRIPLIKARHEAIYRVWIEKAPIGLAEVGRRFGLDHTTILSALRKKGVTDTRQRASKSAEVQHE